MAKCRLYIGGSEHATGHLLYSRFWNKFLKDRGYAPTEEPFEKLINQGMILGMSAYAFVIQKNVNFTDSVNVLLNNENHRNGLFDLIKKASKNYFINEELYNKVLNNNFSSSDLNFLDTYDDELLQLLQKLNIDASIGNITRENVRKIPILVDFVNLQNELDISKFRIWNPEYKDAIIPENYIVGREVEKMSKSKYNVVNPDDICNNYGADTLRLYEMFLVR